MKKIGLLHPELSHLVASLGHGDQIVIADAGLPVPAGVCRIDLAFSPGKPAFIDVLDAVLSEMKVESAVLAEEIRTVPPEAFYQKALERFEAFEGAVEYVLHEDFKLASQNVRAIIRTGEFTPYANVILTCGVVF